ncbi:DUF1641 domain-containing protein [Paenibacillus sediminis]|uniref:Uncharacterized protein YjgD (DUF1641 family) n=1 Tax=Paenibacillus sediminis TaxID=664909 RepID=A0ABS4H2U9_9BACL|nr:DUF1641 domain-containing protein [Paenibacillus sediminis]MBP1936786.1 uncharacterized protein YjgD (DUF1641 family) [Paenibacillus sediminis]
MSETTQQSQEVTGTENQSIRQQLDVLEQLVKPEMQESLNVLVENLPKLAEMVTVLTKSFDFAKSIATDKLLYEDTMHAMNDFLKPVTTKVKSIASAAVEANDRVQADSASTIGIFGLLRMLKDPQVQKMFRFAQAYLDILSEREKQQR